MPTREKPDAKHLAARGGTAATNGSSGPPFMRVNKGLGAVAIYKPARAAGMLIAAVVAILAAGFGIGRATDSNTTSSAPSSSTVRAARASGFEAGFRTGVQRGRAQRPAPAPAAKPKPAKPAKARPAPKPAAAPTAVAGAGALQSGVPYIVKVSRNGGHTQIVRHVEMNSGATYWVCNGGNICTRAGG